MKKIIVFNHKDYMEKEEVISYIKNIKDRIRTDIEVVICPSDVFIPYFSGKYNFKLGSQNVGFENITGESSIKLLKSLKVFYALIAHPERIKNKLEDKSMINKKITYCLENNIIPIVYLKETKEEYERKKTMDVILGQIKSYFFDVDVSSNIIICYEPSINVPINHLLEVVLMIKQLFYRTYNVRINVLFGGGINSSNISKYNEIKEIDGFIIGKASTNVSEAIKILDSV